MDNELMSFLNEKAFYLEKERLKAVKLNYLYKIAKPLRNLLKVVLIILMVINLIIPIVLPVTIAVVIIFILLFLFNDPKEVFAAKLKDDILPEIFKSINKTLTYNPYGYNHQTLIDSEILSKGFFSGTTEIIGEDYVKGQIDNIDVEFFEIRFFEKVTNYTKTAGGCLLSLILIPVEIFKNIFDGDTQSDDVLVGIVRDTKTFFSGFFMFADFHKDFTGKILMIPKNKDRMIDNFNENQSKNLTTVNTENPYINSNFNIYSSDLQLAYYVLSQNLIDRIQIIAEKENALPIISFINGKMYFVIPWNKDFFKFSLNKKIDNGNFFLPYIDEINSFEKIIKDLNLNIRIWSKV